MSESTFPLRKAIPIIAVTWILSLVTTLAFVYVVVPNILKPTWHEVRRFSGTFQEFDTEETESFYISSDHWRLHWTVHADEPPPEDIEFRLFLTSDKRYHPSLVWLVFADFTGSVAENKWWGYEDGTEYITGSGWFSFRLRGARLRWEIAVEAYY